MKHTACSLALLLASTPMFALAPDADYDRGEALFEQGEYREALKWFGRAANQGNTDAQYQIGLMFLEGQGVAASEEDAAYWFRKAAQNGHAPAQFETGYCFLQGIGVQRDERMAAEWFWRAAEGGDPDAALYVARMYRDGKGMKRDLKRARKYYQQAAKAGIHEAEEELEALRPDTPQSTKKRKR